VNSPGGDVDTLIVCPVHIDREEFFGELFEMLKVRSDVEGLTVRSFKRFLVVAFLIFWDFALLGCVRGVRACY
jgi:poly(A) polymerase Pap1